MTVPLFKKQVSHSLPAFLLHLFIFYVTLFLDKKAGIIMNINIDPSWTYRQFTCNLKTLKSQYNDFLMSFSLTSPKERADFIYFIRNQIYSLKFMEWQKDKIWDYLNDNISLNDVILSALRYK